MDRMRVLPMVRRAWFWRTMVAVGCVVSADSAAVGNPRDGGVESAPDAGMPANIHIQLRIAADIRPVVQHYLMASRADARRNLPSDWAHLLPKDAGKPSHNPSPMGGVYLPPWRLEINDDQATLTHYPRGGLMPKMRIWFELKLERKGTAWKVSPQGITFVHAHARRP